MVDIIPARPRFAGASRGTRLAYFQRRQHVGGLQAEGAEENDRSGVGGVESLHEVDGSHHGQVVSLALRLVLQEMLNRSCENRARVKIWASGCITSHYF